MKIVSFVVPVILLLTLQSTHGAELADSPPEAVNTPGGDHRQLVSMPDESRQLMRQDMLDHLSALSEITGHIAEGKLDAVAEVAESRMGKSSMGKHRGSGMGPGRYMPPAMRSIGWAMHEAASDLSQAAGEGDLQATYGALTKVTSTCVACHYSFRTR